MIQIRFDGSHLKLCATPAKMHLRGLSIEKLQIGVKTNLVAESCWMAEEKGYDGRVTVIRQAGKPWRQ